MFKFRCVHCDKKIAVPTEFAGRHVRCPGCGQSTIVPFPSPEELAAAEEVGFHIRADPSAVLASRACKACGATLPAHGPCVQCGADPHEGLKAAFDASLATMLAAPPAPPAPQAAFAVPARRGSPGVWLLAGVILFTLGALLAAACLLL